MKIYLLGEKAEVGKNAILALTKSQINSGFVDGEVHMKGFGSFSTDRVKLVQKGGVIAFIRDDILTKGYCTVSNSIGNIDFQILKF